MKIQELEEYKNRCYAAMIMFLIFSVIGVVWMVFFPPDEVKRILAGYVFVGLSLSDAVASASVALTVYEVTLEGIDVTTFWGKMRVRHYDWNDFGFIGKVLLLSRGRGDPTREQVVCSAEPPYREYSNSVAYKVREKRLVRMDMTDEEYVQFLTFCGGERGETRN